MAAILSFDDTSQMITVKCGGESFRDQVDTCRELRMTFDPTKKVWTASPGRFKEIFAELETFGVQFSEYDRLALNKWTDNLSTFWKLNKRGERRHFDDTCLALPARYDFQKADVQKAINQASCLFKWATGTGKSWALAGLLQYLRDSGECWKAIILTSSIGVLNLGSELKKFLKDYDESRTLVIPSMTMLKTNDRGIFDDPGKYDIIILSYDSFKSINMYYYNRGRKDKKTNVKLHKSPLPLKEWYSGAPRGGKGLVFMDECHLVGNHSSSRNSALICNLPFWDYRYLFSATPADKYEKQYTILKVLDEALTQGLSYQDWLASYCQLGNRFSRWAPNLDTWNIGKWTALQDRLSETYVVTRDKSLLNLPAAIDMPLIQIDMSKQQREIYEQFSNMALALIKKDPHGPVQGLINSFQGLQMIIDNPSSILGSPTLKKLEPLPDYADFVKKIEAFSYNNHFKKLRALKNIIEYECDEMDNKIIVFYFHPKTMEVLKTVFPTAKILSSDKSEDERYKVVDNFRKSKKSKILIASICIANSSFTLTECKAAIFYERTWSGIDYEQARGRIHRIGQDSEVRYYNLCYTNSIDNLQLLSLETKGECIDSIGRRAALTTDEWKLIFGGTRDELEGWLKKLD